MPTQIERKHILDGIDKIINDYNAVCEGRLMLFNINWLENIVYMYYRPCQCKKGGAFDYDAVERDLLKLHSFSEIIWKYR